MGKTLPPGLHFHPTDVQLIKYYLKRKVMGKKLNFEFIPEIDIYKYAPWDLPAKSCLGSKFLKWYFFCPKSKKYGAGPIMNRVTDLGYWKSTGKDRIVRCKEVVAGMIKTLVFHRGKVPRGDQTDWVMYEYRIEENELAGGGVSQDLYNLCVIFKKDGLDPKTGVQYWDVNEEEVNGGEELSSERMSAFALTAPITLNSSFIISSHFPISMSSGSSVPCPSKTLTALHNLPLGSDNVIPPSEAHQVVHEDDDIAAVLDMFSEDSAFILNENNNNEEAANFFNDGNLGADPSSDKNMMYGNLAHLGSRSGPGSNVSSYNVNYTMQEMLQGDDYMELVDFETSWNLADLGRLCDSGSNVSGYNANASHTMDQMLQGDDYIELLDFEASWNLADLGNLSDSGSNVPRYNANHSMHQMLQDGDYIELLDLSF